LVGLFWTVISLVLSKIASPLETLTPYEALVAISLGPSTTTLNFSPPSRLQVALTDQNQHISNPRPNVLIYHLNFHEAFFHHNALSPVYNQYSIIDRYKCLGHLNLQLRLQDTIKTFT
jgi:hypothetical protein